MNSFRFGKRPLALAGAALAGIFAFSATAVAWQNVDQYPTKCGSIDLNLFGEHGDVATSDKWNSVICILGTAYRNLGDWPRNKTPFMWSADASEVAIGGKTGGVIGSIGLGYNAGGISKTPFIGFYDGTKGYWGSYATNTNPSTDREALGMILFNPKDSGGDDSLSFRGFSGGISIYPGSDAGNLSGKRYVVGWEKVSASDKGAFDLDCQYRAVTSDGWRLYFDSVNSLSIKGQFNSEYAGTNNRDTAVIIRNDAKNLYSNYGHDSYGSSSTASRNFGDGFVMKLEKLCLPSY